MLYERCTERRRGSSYHGAGEVAGRSTMTMTSMRSSRHHHHSVCGLESPERRREYVKKPLNAFMLFMKEKRQRVIEECTLKESAAINQILGRKVSLALAGQFIPYPCIAVKIAKCLASNNNSNNDDNNSKFRAELSMNFISPKLSP